MENKNPVLQRPLNPHLIPSYMSGNIFTGLQDIYVIFAVTFLKM